MKRHIDIYREDLADAMGGNRGRVAKAMARVIDNYGDATLELDDSAVKVWSDLHLNHSRIIDYQNRPFNNVYEMNATLWANWQLGVEPQDTLLCVGDVTWGNSSDRIRSENGNPKILVIGNHDVNRDGRLKIEGFHQHYALVTLPGDPPLIVTHGALPNVPPGHINVHGHTHSNISPPNSPHINVSVEQLDYRPISLAQLRKLASAILNELEPDGRTTLVRIQRLDDE